MRVKIIDDDHKREEIIAVHIGKFKAFSVLSRAFKKVIQKVFFFNLTIALFNYTYY